MFFAFNRLSPSYKGIYKGAGLGLSIVKQFVDNLSGEIFVESAEGKGSTIGCYIPFQNPLIVSSKQKYKRKFNLLKKKTFTFNRLKHLA
ncbi:ATP-binding protein [Rickettsiella massiliensis]|uniref:ATP-binding protein n=1 Tax=Rickettsiella massiliensis TaxID=676517 RepID=UPI000A05189B